MRSGGGRPTSALGHKPTYAVQKGMSALHPRADMCAATRDVRFGPKADTGRSVDNGFREFRFAYFERLPILNLAISVVASSSTV